MTNRRTRDETARLEAIAFSIDRASGGINTTLLIVVLAAALSGAGVGYWLRGDLRAAAGGAGVTGFVAVVFVVAASWDLARCAITRQGEPTDDDDRFTQTGPRTLTRLPDGVTQQQLHRYLADVARERVTLSQAGAREHGMSQQQANEVKAWVVGREWVKITNASNGQWEWTEEGRRVRDMLRDGAAWNEIVREVE